MTLTKSLGAKLESIGGVGFVSELFTFLPTAANAAYYCELVKRDRLAREIIRGLASAARAYDSGEDMGKRWQGAFHGDLSALLVEKRKRQSVRDCLREIMQELATGSADGEVIPTGISEMDEKLHLYKGDLFIISAPTLRKVGAFKPDSCDRLP